MKCEYEILYANNELNNNRPWVVFIHGFGGSSRTWERQINLVKANFNVCAVTLPGHGRNCSRLHSVNENLYTHLAKMIIADLKAQGIQEAYLVSVSMGTLIANEMLLADNDFVKKSLLTGPVCGTNAFLYKSAKILAKYSIWMPYNVLISFLGHILLPKRSHQQSREFLMTECLNLTHIEFSKWANALVNNINRAKTLTLDDKKCILVVGDEDFVLKKGVKTLSDRCHLTLHIIRQCGHVCGLHKWKEYNEILLKFLDINNTPILRQ